MDKEKNTFNDYDRVVKEQMQRIDYAYNGSKSLLTMFIAFWSIPTAILAFIFGGVEITADVHLLNVIMLIFSILSFSLVYCSYIFSCKQHDNIYQVCSLACYNKVFYEYPKILQYKSNKEGTVNNEEFLGWEALHVAQDLARDIGFVKEYYITAIVSSILCAIFDTALSVFIFTRPIFTDTWTNILTIIIVCICVTTLAVCMIYSCKIRKNSNIKKMFVKFHEKFTMEYISKAIELNILTKDEAKMCRKIEENKSGV